MDTTTPNQIRALLLSDVKIVAEIARSASPYAWSEQVFHDCLQANYHAWALTHGDGLLSDDILGFVVALQQMQECQLLNICVQPQYQGRGYGRQLLQHVINNAQAHNCQTLLLEVRQSNETAISLYHKLGFLEVGVRKYYYPCGEGREDAVMMVKGL